MFGRKEEKSNTVREYYCYYDSKAEIYERPILALNKQVLLRDVANMLRDPQHKDNPLLVNAEDFSIFKVGEFDSSTGQMTGCSPQHVANLHEIRAMIQRERTETADIRQ